MTLPYHLRGLICGFAGYRRELDKLRRLHIKLANEYGSHWAYREMSTRTNPTFFEYYDDLISEHHITLQAMVDLHSPFMYKCICLAELKKKPSQTDDDLMYFGRQMRHRLMYPHEDVNRFILNYPSQASLNFPDSNFDAYD